MNSDDVQKEVDKALDGGDAAKVGRMVLSSIGGAVPIYGGVVSGLAGAWSEDSQNRLDKLFRAWFQIHEKEIEEIGITVQEILKRLDPNDEAIRKRLESPEYISIMRLCFRNWSAAESEVKRGLIRNLLVNAAHPQQITKDDVIKLFVKWIDEYSEEHFKVIKHVYQNPGSTRAEIWEKTYGTQPPDDSAEADFFKKLIHDLSTGWVIRQHRESDGAGRFYKPPRARRNPSPLHKSAFDDEKPYELTELGKQFVHFTMDDVAPRLSHESPAASTQNL